MVSFSCEVCNDTVVKKKLEQHQQRCRGAYFSCIDCSVTFHDNDHRQHTSCISEAEKYEKGLYKGKKQSASAAKPPAKSPVKQQPEVKSPAKQQPEAKSKSREAAKVTKTKVAKAKVSPAAAKRGLPSALTHLSTGQPQSLYKVVKKADKADRKALLKRLALVVGDDGAVEVKLI